jgi:RNA polymerase sigma factor (sigma-70 family)
MGADDPEVAKAAEAARYVAAQAAELAAELENLRLAKAGDREATARVLSRHHGLIAMWCTEALRPGFELDDLFQEAYDAGLEAIRYFRFNDRAKFPSYLKVCVRRRLARWCGDRRQMPLPAIDDEDLDVLPADEVVDFAWLREAMAALPVADQQVLELKYGLAGGKPLGDIVIGRRLCMSAEHVRWIHGRALVLIRERGEAGRGES